MCRDDVSCRLKRRVLELRIWKVRLQRSAGLRSHFFLRLSNRGSNLRLNALPCRQIFRDRLRPMHGLPGRKVLGQGGDGSNVLFMCSRNCIERHRADCGFHLRFLFCRKCLWFWRCELRRSLRCRSVHCRADMFAVRCRLVLDFIWSVCVYQLSPWEK